MRFLFFFQAEDGIRDLVRSRGLGDVYKRQVFTEVAGFKAFSASAFARGLRIGVGTAGDKHNIAVSYTHLTLPTSDLV